MRHLVDLSVRLTGDGFLVLVCDAEGPVEDLKVLTPAGEYLAQATSADGYLVELALYGPTIVGPLAERDCALYVRKGEFICVLDNAVGRSRSVDVALHAYLTGSEDIRRPAAVIAIPGTESVMLVAGPADEGNGDLWCISWHRGNRQAATVRLLPND